MAIVRAAALLAWLAGCSDDGDDKKDAADGGSDAGRDGGGGMDGGGANDASADGSALTDSGGDGGGISELEWALLGQNNETTRRRAELIMPVFCMRYTACVTDAGLSLDACIQSGLADFDLSVSEGDSTACLDSTLDFSACVGTRASCAAVSECGTALELRDRNCQADGGT